ncbi:MAG: phage tail protein [Veillonella sp.]|nr:phage tail protein [Veillonella sp.]
MAKYPAVITTMAGTNTIAEANASKQALIFTKIVIGAGDMPASIPRATALTDKRLELAITKSVKTGDGQFMVQGLLSNKNLEAGFYAREIGLMAKAGENGQEVLFSYTNGGNYVDYIPDKNTPMDSYTFTITTVIGNAEKVQAIISDNGVASVHDLEAHNADATAHDNRFNAIVRQVNNMITSVDNSDSLAKVPTLQLVKTLLSSLNIKNATDVVNALESEKSTGLGIRYDFSNVNAWYICLGKLFGNLIIQGGKFVPEIASITFPIRFNEVLAVLPMMLDEPTPWHEMMIRPKAITTSTFKMVSGSNNTNYPKSRNNGCWIAVGI